ncbi:MAG: hypothetical protein AAB955_00310 [Patescibacteria group bacterium]
MALGEGVGSSPDTAVSFGLVALLIIVCALVGDAYANRHYKR